MFFVFFFFPLFNIWLSYLLLLRIPFGVLLLSIARQRINMDHRVGFAGLPHRETPPHLGPLLGTEPHLTVGPLLYLPDWKITPGTRRTQQRRERGKRGRWEAGWYGEDQQGKKSIAHRFLTKGFFSSHSLSFFYLVSCQTSPVKLARGSRCQRVNHSNIDLIM